MSLAPAHGVYVIAPTPFHGDGRVDLASADRMTDFFLGAGVTVITVLGQMGEAPKLDPAEALDVAQRVIRRASVPVSRAEVDYLLARIARPDPRAALAHAG